MMSEKLHELGEFGLIRQIRQKAGTAEHLVMGIGDASMEVDGREIYSAKDLRVGLFTSTDSF